MISYGKLTRKTGVRGDTRALRVEATGGAKQDEGAGDLQV